MKVIYGENQMKLVTEEITKIGARSDVLQNKVPAGNGSDEWHRNLLVQRGVSLSHSFLHPQSVKRPFQHQ